MGYAASATTIITEKFIYYVEAPHILMLALAHEAIVFITHNLDDAHSQNLDTDMITRIRPTLKVDHDDGQTVLDNLLAHNTNDDLDGLTPYEVLMKSFRIIAHSDGTKRVAICNVPVKAMVKRLK